MNVHSDMKIKIKNLRLRTIVGIYAWERKETQDVIINITIEFDGSGAAQTDNVRNTVDYKALKKRIVSEVESSRFKLLEKLADHVLRIILEDKKVLSARVEVDKPHALRFADSVSVTCTGSRQ
ncbi:dihydroneopterin aldolase [bacterium]|nr:dihydroneopterin aldolase [bacterium]